MIAILLYGMNAQLVNRKAIEAVDRTLRDIKQNEQPMGGIIQSFFGDFRQSLPGTRADEIRSCLKSSVILCYIIPMHLSTNICVCKTGETKMLNFQIYCSN